jgi:hypothetical protein
LEALDTDEFFLDFLLVTTFILADFLPYLFWNPRPLLTCRWWWWWWSSSSSIDIDFDIDFDIGWAYEAYMKACKSNSMRNLCIILWSPLSREGCNCGIRNPWDRESRKRWTWLKLCCFGADPIFDFVERWVCRICHALYVEIYSNARHIQSLLKGTHVSKPPLYGQETII